MTERAFVVRAGKAQKASRDEATAALGSADLVWVHLDGMSADAKGWLEARRLPGLVVNALLATETRPRFESFDDGAILNLRAPRSGSEVSADLLASIRMWIAKGRVFSVTLRDISAVDVAEAALRAGRLLDPGDLVSAIAMAITDELDPDVAALGDTLDDCEEMFGGSNTLELRRVVTEARSKAIVYRRFVAPQRTALERLAALDADWLEADDRLHLGEAADRAARMAEELEAIRERAGLIHDQLTDLRAETIDTRSLVISVVALVFLPLTFLTGLLGMNVAGIPFAHEPWAFAAVCAVCMIVAATVAVYFIRARWFR